jgi:uncharacterized protein (TIGR02145 family)
MKTQLTMKKTIFTLVLLAFIGLSNLHAQVGIGTTTPEASSILDVESTTQGFLPPRMETSERDAIASPAEGLTIFNTENDCLEFYNGTYWISACDGTIASGPCAGSLQEIDFNGLTYKPVVSSGNCWLDRNLGATQVATSRDDAAAYGHLYQWGRGNDGHQLRASSAAARPTTQNSLTPGNTFLTTGGVITSSDWYTGPDPEDRWNAPAQINNPCPTGYRVPSSSEWGSEVASWNNALPDRRDRAFQSPLKLTVAGIRQFTDGQIVETTVFSRYWTNLELVMPFADVLQITETGAGTGSGEQANFGLSVRCIQD